MVFGEGREVQGQQPGKLHDDVRTPRSQSPRYSTGMTKSAPTGGKLGKRKMKNEYRSLLPADLTTSVCFHELVCSLICSLYAERSAESADI